MFHEVSYKLKFLELIWLDTPVFKDANGFTPEHFLQKGLNW